MAEIFEKALNYAKDSYMLYKGTGSYFALFFIAMIVIFYIPPDRPKHDALKNKRISNRAYCIYYPLLAFLMIFSPLIAKPVVSVITVTVYWRIFWIIPMTVIIALAMTTFVMKVPAGPKRLLATIGCLVVIVVSGSLIVNSDNYQKPANWYKIPYEAVEICEMIRDDTDGFASVAAPPQLTPYIRQYDASISMPYGRYLWGGHAFVASHLASNPKNIEIKKGYFNSYSVNYMVILSENPDEIILPEWCEVVGVSGSYVLIKII